MRYVPQRYDGSRVNIFINNFGQIRKTKKFTSNTQRREWMLMEAMFRNQYDDILQNQAKSSPWEKRYPKPYQRWKPKWNITFKYQIKDLGNSVELKQE